MNKVTIVALMIFAFVFAVAAQSGRSKAMPIRTPLPAVQGAEVPQAASETEGYSESASNAARTVWAKPRNSNRSKIAAKPQPPSPAPPMADATSDEEVVKVETSLVTVPVSVYDRNGLYIPNLRQSEFKIYEDGVEQEIAYFGTSEKPFTVILLIDVSPSTSYKIEEIQQAAIGFIDLLKPADSVTVIQFDQFVSVLTESTNDRQKIYKAIRRSGFGNGTALYEAVDFSLRRRLNKIEGRKAIVLFTDGVDTASRGATFENTLGIAEESDSLVFPIYYNTFLANIGIGTGGVMSTPPTLGIPGGGRAIEAMSAEYARGRTYLNELAAVTGGRVFRAESTPGGLNAAFEGIAEELSRQYNIGYFPKDEGQTGERKQIKVRVERPKLVVRSRDSYIVGANAPSAAAPK
jgi:Ca-activated chloride channel homolog